MQPLKDKNILVIGATGGIGSRTAKLLAGSGAKLFLTGRNAEKLQAVAVSCNVSSDRCFALDCSQAGSVNDLKERYFQQFSSIDILINAAGIGIIKAMNTLDETEFLHTLNANLVAPFLLMKTVVLEKQAFFNEINSLACYDAGMVGKKLMRENQGYSSHTVLFP